MKNTMMHAYEIIMIDYTMQTSLVKLENLHKINFPIASIQPGVAWIMYVPVINWNYAKGNATEGALNWEQVVA